MAVRELKPGIYEVGAQDWDRRLFDELIPLPDGTSYNAYLIRGSEKVALIDTVDPTKEDELFENLESLGIIQLDFVIPNHAEQDHSGVIPRVLERYPDAQVVTNSKCKEFLQDLLHIEEEKFMVKKDGATLSLGDRTLQFMLAPWVHWPETMLTYLREDKILFPCDLFGSHLASSDLFVSDEARVHEAAKRYYAEIMMPFRTLIKKHLDKVQALELELIAASHGPVCQRPAFIIDAYREWTADKVKNEVLVPYVSMHGSTERMVHHFVNAVTAQGITVKPFNLPETDIGQLAIALVDAATIIIATPTVLAGPHPAAVYATHLVNALRPKLRFAGIIGSYGWGGKMEEQLQGMLGNLKVELLPSVIVKGHPREEDFGALDRLAAEIAERHKREQILN